MSSIWRRRRKSWAFPMLRKTFPKGKNDVLEYTLLKIFACGAPIHCICASTHLWQPNPHLCPETTVAKRVDLSWKRKTFKPGSAHMKMSILIVIESSASYKPQHRVKIELHRWGFENAQNLETVIGCIFQTLASRRWRLWLDAITSWSLEL